MKMEDDEKESFFATARERIEAFMAKIYDIYEERQLERIAGSFAFLEGTTRKRRLQAIMDLSVERERLFKEHGVLYDGSTRHCLFASGSMSPCIAHLIQGDIRDVKECADMYLFEGECAVLKAKWVPIYAKFRAIALAAITDEADIQ